MKLPLQITFRNMDRSEAVEADVREKSEKLDQFFQHIMHCKVVVEAHHKHHHKGNIYHVRIDVTVPGHELVVSREPKEHHAHEDVYVAVRDAFDAMKRQLEDYSRQLRGDVKIHEVAPHGVISELVPMEDYGRIQSADNRSIYFHRNSVINADFDSLSEGDPVRFDEETGDEGPQASTVRVIGKHHIVG
jgi:ribosomal subunit interface protein